MRFGFEARPARAERIHAKKSSWTGRGHDRAGQIICLYPNSKFMIIFQWSSKPNMLCPASVSLVALESALFLLPCITTHRMIKKPMIIVKGTVTAQYIQNHRPMIWLPSDACQLNIGMAKKAYSFISGGLEMGLKSALLTATKVPGNKSVVKTAMTFIPALSR